MTQRIVFLTRITKIRQVTNLREKTLWQNYKPKRRKSGIYPQFPLYVFPNIYANATMRRSRQSVLHILFQL